jgi:hypothetical protein
MTERYKKLGDVRYCACQGAQVSTCCIAGDVLTSAGTDNANVTLNVIANMMHEHILAEEIQQMGCELIENITEKCEGSKL